MTRKLLLAAAAIAALPIGLALAQTYPAPTVQTISPTDLFQDIPGGVPSSSNFYATPAQINNVPGYTKAVPVTGFSATFGNAQSDMLLYPAGTLATGTVVMAAIPSEGSRACVFSSQAITALTFTPNSGQTMGATTPTTIPANGTVCLTYTKATATWDRSR